MVLLGIVVIVMMKMKPKLHVMLKKNQDQLYSVICFIVIVI